MYFKTFPVGAFQCNCTVIGNPDSGKAIIVDPGDDADAIIRQVKSRGFDVQYLVHTHAHIDHIGATKQVCQELGGTICLHKGDNFLYENMAMQAAVLGLNMDCDVLPVAKSIEHGDVLECDDSLKTQVLFTPGHTPGSVCFLMNDPDLQLDAKSFLFSGDTLFARSIGRTDLWGGDYDQIIASIRERLLVLPPETIVIPGHGPNTTIGQELKHNPFFSNDQF